MRIVKLRIFIFAKKKHESLPHENGMYVTCIQWEICPYAYTSTAEKLTLIIILWVFIVKDHVTVGKPSPHQRVQFVVLLLYIVG